MHCQCFEIIVVYLRFFANFEKLGNFQEYVPQIRLDKPVTIRHVPFDLILMYAGRQVWYLLFTIVAQSKIPLRAETNATDAADAVDASNPRSSEGVQNFPSFSSHLTQLIWTRPWWTSTYIGTMTKTSVG